MTDESTITEKDRFLWAIDHGDDLVAVLRAHQSIQKQIDRLLNHAIPGSEPLTKRLTYTENVAAAAEIGLLSAEQKGAFLWVKDLHSRFVRGAENFMASDVDEAKKLITRDGVIYMREMIEFYNSDPNDAKSLVRYAIISVYTETEYALERAGADIS